MEGGFMKQLWNNIFKNALLLYCGLFTFATLLNSILYLAKGIYEDPNGNWHEIDRAIIVLIGVLAFELCIHIKTKYRIMNAFIGYIPTLLLAFGYVWLAGLREPLSKSAYRDIFINYTMMFLCVSVIYNIINLVKKKERTTGKQQSE
jgi:UDP-N-acetylmuramyl pentapeptide phosphotransferase/UDP-N-acetylglucosamine-1-phosphate transferase